MIALNAAAVRHFVSPEVKYEHTKKQQEEKKKDLQSSSRLRLETCDRQKHIIQPAKRKKDIIPAHMRRQIEHHVFVAPS